MGSRSAVAVFASVLLMLSGSARAQDANDLKARFDALQQQFEQLKAQLDAVTTEMKKQQQTQEQQVQEQKAKNAAFFERKPGDALTFLAPGGGEVTLYGNLDVSFDYTTKGLKSDYGDMGGMPVGRMG